MTTHAAALFYQTFFSLFPFALFLVALLGLLRLRERFDALLVQARVVLPGQTAEAVEQGIEQIRDQAGAGCSPSASSSPSGRPPRRSGWPCTL
jgi:membrane protein